MGQRLFFSHDGSTNDLVKAIDAHGAPPSSVGGNGGAAVPRCRRPKRTHPLPSGTHFLHPISRHYSVSCVLCSFLSARDEGFAGSFSTKRSGAGDRPSFYASPLCALSGVIETLVQCHFPPSAKLQPQITTPVSLSYQQSAHLSLLFSKLRSPPLK